MKILIVASTMVHIKNFHLPYIEEFKRRGHTVLTLANGEEADFNIPFKKKALCLKNLLLVSKIKKILKREDVLLIAGKGGEEYQEIMGIKYPFSDHTVVERLLEQKGKRPCN